jgi:HAMP domain-containing protein
MRRSSRASSLKESGTLLNEYRQALAKLIENSKEIDELVAEMADSAAAIVKGAGAMKADVISDRQRLEAESNAIVGETARLIIMVAAGGFLLGGLLALLLGRGISRPIIAMCKAMRELAGGNFDVVLPGLGRKDELAKWSAPWRSSSRRPWPRPSVTLPVRMRRTSGPAPRGAPS